MNRRGFFASLAGASAFALDPERALWVPGAKTISIPSFSASTLKALAGYNAGVANSAYQHEHRFLLDGEVLHFKEFMPGWAIAPINLNALKLRPPPRASRVPGPVAPPVPPRLR